MNDTVMFGEDRQDRFGRSVARADGTRLVILLETTVWDSVDTLCQRESLELAAFVEAGCIVHPGESPADILYRTALGYWIRMAAARGLGVSAKVVGGVTDVEAILAEARRRSRI